MINRLLSPCPGRSLCQWPGVKWLWVLILVLCTNTVSGEQSRVVNALDAGSAPLGKYFQVFTETSAPLPWYEALQVFNRYPAVHSTHQVLAAGIGAPPHWLRLVLNNGSAQTIERHLFIDAAWLDEVDIYLLDSNQQLQKTWRTGDSKTFSGRTKATTGFLHSVSLPPGKSEVLVRIATPDPLVVPMYLLTASEFENNVIQHYYSYGFSYGYLLALITFNAMLYFGLRDHRHLLYAVFLSIFTITNIAYTGHGYVWLWPNSPEWQRWANPVLMYFFGSAGLVFAISFLNIRTERKRLYRLIIAVIVVMVPLLLLGVIARWQIFTMYLSFIFMTIYALLMLTMGVSMFSRSSAAARYYIYAAIAGVCGVAITAASVWGFIPYTAAGFRAAELGMLVEATLLALALAARIREVQINHLNAEKLASTDPLTGIKNRRAFYLTAPAIWSNSLRYRRPLSAIILDLDHFKCLNDSHGHASGDHVLKVVGVLLRQQARLSDLVVRWGGEEFLLLLPETNIQEATALAERLRELLSAQHIRYGDKHLHVSASFGVAERRTSDSSIDQLIERADSALYQAKHAGRNCTRAIGDADIDIDSDELINLR